MKFFFIYFTNMVQNGLIINHSKSIATSLRPTKLSYNVKKERLQFIFADFEDSLQTEELFI